MTVRAPEIPLPREIENDACAGAVRDALTARTRLLWPGGALAASIVPPTPILMKALRAAAAGGLLTRGLEGAEGALASEQRGLAVLPADEARRQGSRVSRLLLASNDGAERLYRRVEHLVIAHAPRVLACVVDCDSAMLGGALYAPGEIAKLVLAGRKVAVIDILRAIAG